MLIRNAEPSDAQAFATFLKELDWFSGIRETSQDEVREISSRALDSDSVRVLLVAEEGNEIVGYVHLVFMDVMFLPGPSAYLSELFVLPRLRSKGVGSSLLEQAVAKARARKATRIMLNNDREKDSYERGFYAKHGFVERPSMANLVLKLKYEN